MRKRLLMTLPTMLSLAIPLSFGSLPAFADDAPFSASAVSKQERKSLTAASEGIRMLRAGEVSKASAVFNAALKFEPENAHLHFLNGVAYHLLFSQGQQADKELAETAYSLALKLAPDHALASYYLGLLHLDSRNYAKAQAALAHTLLLERNDPAALHALAVASYYAHDIGMALWAIERVEQTQASSPEILRTSAMIYAAAGRSDSALERSRKFKTAVGEEPGEYLQKRVLRWNDFHTSNGGRFVRTATETIPLTPDLVTAPPPKTSVAPPPPPPPPLAENASSQSSGKILKNWSDCPQAFPAAQNNNQNTSNNSSVFQDETAALPALPSPCDRGAMPKMAMLDTAIISMVESQSTSRGINLLDGLRLMLTANRADTFTLTSTATPQKSLVRTITRGIGLDNLGGAVAALAYSLNIANSGNDRNQVLARPTLIALDRQPSTFFSGSSLSTAVQGSLGGGTLVEHPAGISLSVTPTFVDNETVLLSVRVARSFFPAGTNDIRSSTVVKTRNAVSASVLMKMGETLILSGLTERETIESESGVPLLKNIPIIQYLFSNETVTDNTRSVLVMITPRQPQAGVNMPSLNRDSAADPSQQSSLKELRQQINPAKPPAPNIDAILMDLEDNHLYREFRTGDIRAEDWRRPPALERTLKQIAGFLYY